MKPDAQGGFKTDKNKRDQRRAAAVVLGLLAALTVLSWTYFVPSHRDAPSTSRLALGVDLPPYWAWLESDTRITPKLLNADRTVYAYSVIPGGVTSNKDLKQALARDPVAASHYAGFNAQAAKPVKLDRPRLVYLSYRLGNHIYWTSKKVTLRAGETLLTDGAHLVRGRCGNRISEVPATPTTDGEPPEPILSAPVVPHTTEETVDLPPPPPIWTESPPPFVVAMVPTPAPSGGGGVFVPPLPFVPCCSGSSGGPRTPTPPPSTPPPPGPPPVIPPPSSGPTPGPPDTPPPPVVPPVPTPEPQSLELLLIGLVGAIALLKLRRS